MRQQGQPDGLGNGAAARRGASPDAQLTVSGPKAALVGVVLQPGAAAQLAQAGKLDVFDPNFAIVTP